MKRTTYIIFGMLLAGLVVMCGGIFYSSTQFFDGNDGFMDINGEQKNSTVAGVQSGAVGDGQRYYCG